MKTGEWKVIAEVLSDESRVYNVVGQIDTDDVDVVGEPPQPPSKLEIGCSSRQAATAVARHLNNASYVRAI